MKKIKMIAIVCCLSSVGYAGDTNFVHAFNAIWQTHNASNILVFVEQNVVTNASPEVLFARGTVAIALQAWIPGASNFWEQAIQMISTNSVYSEIGKTNAIKQLQGLQDFFSEVSNDPPTWNTNNHAVAFARVGDKVPYLHVLQDISTIETVEK